jgi:hypothetical protein
VTAPVCVVTGAAIGTGAITFNDTELKILRYLRSLPLDALPSTVRDIQHGARPKISSTSVVVYNLANLERKGLVHRVPDVARSIRLVERMAVRG